MKNILESSAEIMKHYRICTNCRKDLTIDNFYTRKRGGYYSQCKSCNSKRRAIYKIKNFEKIRETDLIYMNQEKNFIRSALSRIFKPSSINPNKSNSSNYQRKGWTPEITLQELYEELMLHIELMKQKLPNTDGRICRYCDQPWTYIRKRRTTATRETTWTNFSVDRFYSEETYKKGNIIFCCSKCNAIKNASTKTMWIRFLEIDKELNETK